MSVILKTLGANGGWKHAIQCAGFDWPELTTRYCGAN